MEGAFNLKGKWDAPPHLERVSEHPPAPTQRELIMHYVSDCEKYSGLSITSTKPDGRAMTAAGVRLGVGGSYRAHHTDRRVTQEPVKPVMIYSRLIKGTGGGERESLSE